VRRFNKVTIKDESDLLDNLKKQLRKTTTTKLSDSDFKQIHLTKSNNILKSIITA
jgi:hypothetical protein